MKSPRDKAKSRATERAEPERRRLLQQAAEAMRRGSLAEAERASRQVLARAPDDPDALNFLGLVALGHGRGADAVAVLEKAVAGAPTAAMMRCNLAFALRSARRLEDAAREAGEAARLDPKLAAAHAVLGTTLADLARPAEALAPLKRALELAPGLGRVHFALGDAYRALGREDDAGRHYEEALKASPQYDQGRAHLGWLHVRARRYDDAARWFRSDLVAKRSSRWWPKAGAPPLSPPPVPVNALKLVHDIEQFGYLAEHGLLPMDLAPTVAAYEAANAKVVEATTPTVMLPDDDFAPIAETFARIVHWRETPAHDVAALGQGWDRAEIEARYATPPGICWVDGLLSPRALEDLRRFCLDSTIWNDISHNYREGGTRRAYLGTYADDGFCCPLLFQIAEELAQSLPAIFKGEPLHQMWAYKYEANQEGIDLHGDNAAINVNFWITPDEANLDPASGGLVVYPVEAPAEWNFDDFNKDAKRIRGFLDDSGVAPVVVPYRQNRAVIFNSDLFHATAPLSFKPGYENRRINITMLFGRRDG